MPLTAQPSAGRRIDYVEQLAAVSSELDSVEQLSRAYLVRVQRRARWARHLIRLVQALPAECLDGVCRYTLRGYATRGIEMTLLGLVAGKIASSPYIRPYRPEEDDDWK